MWVFCICSKGLCIACVWRERKRAYIHIYKQRHMYIRRERSFQKTSWLKGKAVEYKICFKDKATTGSWGVTPHSVLIICFFLAHHVYSCLSLREMSLHVMNEKQTKLDFISIFMELRGYVLKRKVLWGFQRGCPQQAHWYRFQVPETVAPLAARAAPARSHTFTRYRCLCSHSRHRKHRWNWWKKLTHSTKCPQRLKSHNTWNTPKMLWMYVRYIWRKLQSPPSRQEQDQRNTFLSL